MYGNISERIKKIIEKKSVKNRHELEDVIAMIEISRKTSNNNILPTLKNLSRAYGDKRRKSKTNDRPFVNYIFELNSPGGHRYVECYEMNNTSTQVSVILENKSSISICQLRGINLELRARWKDDNNLIVETKKDYIIDFACKQIDIKGIVINVEFIKT